MKCPYCARPLRRGVKCRACRRYVFSWPHIFLAVVLAAAAIAALLMLLE